MRCAACDLDVPEKARFCPGCGREVVTVAEPTRPLTVEGGERGAWRWFLIFLLALERLVAWLAFAPEGPLGTWEARFFWGYGVAAFILTAFLLIFRRRSGGWLAGLSGLALMARSWVPLLGEKPADGAIWALMVASATLTFAFFHEQSWWGRSLSVQGSSPQED